MGLAGTKNKKKWAKDPNNTAWSRNTDTFGQKILRSQGWQPGQYLGAENASHSEFYSAANASHIRAVLKDDNMGLGARRNQGDECTGLDALQELLGRLNGKSEEALGAERKKREDVRVNQYLERKLGTIRFVYGGLLVGDKVQALADELAKEKEEKAAAGEAGGKKDKKSKKRKADEDEDDESTSKKDKKSKKRRSEEEVESESKAERKARKEKKRRDKEAAESRSDEEQKPNDDGDEDASSRKKSRKDKKEKRKRSKDDNDAASPEDTSDSQSRKKKKKSKAEKDEATDSTPSATQTSTPAASGTSTPVSEVPHRHLARRRFIAQKRAAVMDPAALNQIFMIKA